MQIYKYIKTIRPQRASPTYCTLTTQNCVLGMKETKTRGKISKSTVTLKKLKTVSKWDSEIRAWIFGVHRNASAEQKAIAETLLARQQKLRCHGCGVAVKAHINIWAKHVKSDACIKTRASLANRV